MRRRHAGGPSRPRQTSKPPAPPSTSCVPGRAEEVQRDAQRTALLAALTTIVLWASAFVGIRAAGRFFSPGALTLVRLLIGSVALGVVVLIRREPMPRGRDWILVLLCGLLWFGAYNVLLNQAEQIVDAGTAAMLVNISPLIIAILSGWLLNEGFPRRLFAGCAIAFGGSAIIGFATSSHGPQGGLGAVLCVAAAAAYSCGVTAEKPLLARVSALNVTWLACTVGAVLSLPFVPSLAQALNHTDGDALAWALYLGLFPTAVGFSFWAFALARTSAGRMGALTYLVPPVAILLGWVFLGVLPPWLALLGGALCLADVAIARGVSGRRLLALPLRRRMVRGESHSTG
ncbi:MAG: DMT family transporter [Candidatus Dormibacteraeota bacterium]|nr:DMT family transporter [Candidatus Dormibacteraeota bacterium]